MKTEISALYDVAEGVAGKQRQDYRRSHEPAVPSTQLR
jgi:hypothetical protein